LSSSPLRPRPAILLPLLLVVALALALAGLIWLWRPADDGAAAIVWGGSHPASAPTGGDFKLRGRDGPVALSRFRGKVVLLYFGYTSCPDICPTNLAIIAYALKQLSLAERARVQVLFVTVDPARDTPERLAQYTAYFDSGILGLSGSDAQVAAAAARYGAAYRRVEQPESAMGYLVDHSALTYVIDTRGRWVATLPHATPAEEIVAVLRRLLAASG